MNLRFKDSAKILYLLTIIFLLVSVSFSTLLERKILAFFNYRLGPTKSFYIGIFIPFRDFLKLVFKNSFLLNFTGYFFLIPFFGLLILLLFFYFFFINQSNFSILYGVLYVFIIYSLTIYFFFFMSMSRNNFYSYLSSYRILSQSIRYEIGFVFCFIFLLFSWANFDLLNFVNINYIFFSNVFLSVIFFIFLLGERGRSPFDFLEGESELIRGFNIEYFGGIFSIIFLVEYGLLIFSRLLTSYLIFGRMVYFFSIFFFYLFRFIRCIFPRLRFDQIIIFFWVYVLLYLILIIFFISIFS